MVILLPELKGTFLQHNLFTIFLTYKSFNLRDQNKYIHTWDWAEIFLGLKIFSDLLTTQTHTILRGP